MQYLIYLRKSRADQEAEMRGEGETLARHEKALLELARRQHLPIADIYREVVSGETIASRPMMQQLLSEVEQGVWDGVLVMEVERLARGDTIDQGIVAQAFKCPIRRSSHRLKHTIQTTSSMKSILSLDFSCPAVNIRRSNAD